MTSGTDRSGIASNAALAIGLAYLGVACGGREPSLSRPIGWVALATTGIEVVVILVGQIGGLDTVENVLSLITGALLRTDHRDRVGLRLSRFLLGPASVEQTPIDTPA